MKYLILSAVLGLTLGTSCAQSGNDGVKIPLGSKGKPSPNEQVATFSEGCFWHSEIIFQSLEGVRDAVSGYAGGFTPDPTYEKVETGNTGYAETVNVYYDPSKISFETLVKAFFASHDPTQLNRQGNDEGPQYRSIVFYRNDREKAIIEAQIKQIADSKKYSGKIVTEVLPFKNFFPAEDYHQEYVFHHPENGYVAGVCIPEYMEFRKTFPGPFKPGY
jgi:peptide-methionine (S)-S-oxide reductase